MNYELGKQLKDAGFPQDLEGANGGYMKANGALYTGKHPQAYHFCYIPTLEELIEACGDKFDTLTWDSRGEGTPKEWEAYPREEYLYGEGSVGRTPSEAVARLWLALNPLPENHKDV